VDSDVEAPGGESGNV